MDGLYQIYMKVILIYLSHIPPRVKIPSNQIIKSANSSTNSNLVFLHYIRI